MGPSARGLGDAMLQHGGERIGTHGSRQGAFGHSLFVRRQLFEPGGNGAVRGSEGSQNEPNNADDSVDLAMADLRGVQDRPCRARRPVANGFSFAVGRRRIVADGGRCRLGGNQDKPRNELEQIDFGLS